MKQQNDAEQRRPRLALIATYPKMAEIFLRLAEGLEAEVTNIHASFEQAVDIAREMEPGIDAFLSRGGTAKYIENAVDLPVIFIPITPFDLVRIVHSMPPDEKEVAFFHYQRRIWGIKDIEAMYGVKIHEYCFEDRGDILRGMTHAKGRGISTIIGGEVSCACAQSLGMKGYEISAGEDAVSRAMDEAVQILYEKRKEKRRNARLKAAFDSLAEGVLVTDEEKKVVISNPAAEKIIGFQHTRGQPLRDDLSDESFKAAYQTREPAINYTQTINGAIITASHHPVFMEGRFVGFVSTYQDITRIQTLENKIRREIHSKGFEAKNHLENIVTADPGMLHLKKVAEVYAKTSSAILIEGESGTGKELFAQSLHNASQCAGGPFVAINCAVIPENLLESELFGYAPGAFTGAAREGRQGLFELAHDGTIFLDEIGELSKSLQTRLLRVIQEKEIMRIGGNKIIPVNTRIISATNKNLRKQIELSEFRDDLYYRLAVFQIKVPPLRERRSDIRLIGDFFLSQMGCDLPAGKKDAIFSVLDEYAWPGNIRELQNVMERMAMLHLINERGDIGFQEQIELLGLHKGDRGDSISLKVDLGAGLKDILEQVERDVIDYMMSVNNNDQKAVAEKLAVGRTTLWRKRK